MNDSDWRDPFSEDEAARERERRRAERDARRRGLSESARQSLGERVRDGMSATDPAEPPTRALAVNGDGDGDGVIARPAKPPGPPQPPESPLPLADGPPPPPPRRPSEATQRRRLAALFGVLALIALVAAAGVLISQRNDEPVPPPTTTKARKTISVTIPEGYDRSQVAGVAKEAGLEGDYEKATRSSGAIDLNRYGAQGADSLEGFLFPATYELYEGAEVESLVKKQLEAFQQNMDGLNLSYPESQGLSPYDVVIVASMIEREIAVPEERALAASVIYNRLEAGDTLGIDATIRFEDQNYDEPLVQSRLDTDTPYNTRINPGLPPGPIGNPGLASLEAAADPARSDFYYFVVKPGTCNEHTFVETDAEFAAAEAKYQAALQAQGGSPTDC